MAHVELTEQGTAERFVEGVGKEACGIPAYDSWRMWDGQTGGWFDVGNGAVRKLVARSVRAYAGAEKWGGGAMDERAFWVRSLSWQGQNAALSLLRQSPEFSVEPEQFDREEWGVLVPGGRVTADDLREEREEPPAGHVYPGDLMHRRMLVRDPWAFRDGAVPEYCAAELSRAWPKILEFLAAALKRDRSGPRLMVRADITGGRLDGLYPLMRTLWGDYVEKIPAKVWLHPLALSPGWVQRIQGCRLLFLEECRQNWGGQQAALATWLMDREVTWWGADGVFRSLDMPTHLILCGVGTRPTSIDPTMAEAVWFVPPISARGRSFRDSGGG